jgi:hypothetical protein
MNERFPRGFDPRVVRLQPWKVWALAAVGGAVALALMVAVAGVLLVVVPVILLAGLVAKLLLGTGRPRTPGTPNEPRPPGRPGVIEGRYEVVEVRRDRDLA